MQQQFQKKSAPQMRGPLPALYYVVIIGAFLFAGGALWIAALLRWSTPLYCGCGIIAIILIGAMFLLFRKG